MNNQLELKAIPKNQLSQATYVEIVSLCSQAIEEDYDPYLTSFDDSVHFLGFLDGKIVSHALWITRWLQIDGGSLMRTAYIEGVATDQKYRERGYATAVLKRLVNEIADFEICALSPAKTSLYLHLGWHYWQGPLSHRKEGTSISDPEEEAVMILRLPKTPNLDLSLPISIEWREGEVW